MWSLLLCYLSSFTVYGCLEACVQQGSPCGPSSTCMRTCSGSFGECEDTRRKKKMLENEGVRFVEGKVSTRRPRRPASLWEALKAPLSALECCAMARREILGESRILPGTRVIHPNRYCVEYKARNEISEAHLVSMATVRSCSQAKAVWCIYIYDISWLCSAANPDCRSDEHDSQHGNGIRFFSVSYPNGCPQNLWIHNTYRHSSCTFYIICASSLQKRAICCLLCQYLKHVYVSLSVCRQQVDGDAFIHVFGDMSLFEVTGEHDARKACNTKRPKIVPRTDNHRAAKRTRRTTRA